METILKILKEKSGTYVSGEELAKISGMTRAGIWKQICRLRAAGYRLDSFPRKGYRLVEVTQGLHPLEIKESLQSKTFGQVVYYREEVESTNDWARSLANQAAPEGTLVITESQTKGKGRMGRSWSSARGLGLWFSLILRPKIGVSELAGITILAAVTIAKAVFGVSGVQIDIKWPNDLICKDRKLGGILAEINGEMDRVNYLILGVGLNINHTPVDFPPELAGWATSLRMIKDEEVSRKRILQEFLRIFEQDYYSLSETGLGETIDYARRYSATLGKEVTINFGIWEDADRESGESGPGWELVAERIRGQDGESFLGGFN